MLPLHRKKTRYRYSGYNGLFSHKGWKKLTGQQQITDEVNLHLSCIVASVLISCLASSPLVPLLPYYPFVSILHSPHYKYMLLRSWFLFAGCLFFFLLTLNVILKILSNIFSNFSSLFTYDFCILLHPIFLFLFNAYLSLLAGICSVIFFVISFTKMLWDTFT